MWKTTFQWLKIDINKKRKFPPSIRKNQQEKGGEPQKEMGNSVSFILSISFFKREMQLSQALPCPYRSSILQAEKK